MTRTLVLLGLALAAADVPTPAAQSIEDPGAIVRSALRAVEGDSVPALRARWTTRLAADPADRAAMLGLATLDRLTYDYPSAERRYAELYGGSLAADRFSAYARLGAGQALDTRGHLTEAGHQLARARETARRAGDARAEAEALLALAFIRAQAQGVQVGFATIDSADR